jgi:hypothetical protein
VATLRGLAWTSAFLGGTACGGSTQEAASADKLPRRDTEITHDECDVRSSTAERIDANNDKRADVTVVRSGERELCRAVDLNFDGLIDRYSYLDEAGRLRRQESDYDRDGRVDEISLFKAGVLAERHRATTLDPRLDTWQTYVNGQLVRTERDSNGDGVVDQWWEYKSPSCPLIHSDVNNDGRPDPGASVDYCKETGYVPPERMGPAKTKSPTFETPGGNVEEVDSRPDDSKGSGDGKADESKPASEVPTTEGEDK